MREVYSTMGIAWLVVAGVPSIMKSGFFSVSPLLELLFPLAYVVLPVLFLPLAATMVRRLHDVGKKRPFPDMAGRARSGLAAVDVFVLWGEPAGREQVR